MGALQHDSPKTAHRRRDSDVP